ncbi:hypothetical protein DPMN_136387 [Dreissena polymorpha]|uniref:Uncharacterized protein n=1 Tax=Dreissena polymorpha TaxID=45954 RepID=A0A9D4JFH4_DREPO|nr:hypothetical protein DPMN_136387 [Dreissena polymorpha]
MYEVSNTRVVSILTTCVLMLNVIFKLVAQRGPPGGNFKRRMETYRYCERYNGHRTQGMTANIYCIVAQRYPPPDRCHCSGGPCRYGTSDSGPCPYNSYLRNCCRNY